MDRHTLDDLRTDVLYLIRSRLADAEHALTEAGRGCNRRRIDHWGGAVQELSDLLDEVERDDLWERYAEACDD